jgi:hypothetical protein
VSTLTLGGSILVRTLLLVFVSFVSFVVTIRAGDPCVSGVAAGGKPGPYTFHVATGPQRGQLTCYVCETEQRPAVIVFARSMSDPLAKLVKGLDKAVTDNKTQELRAWVTFLSDDQTGLDPKLVTWAKKHSVRDVPLGVFEDVGGPPTYKLAKDADVTVLLYAKRKVVSNFAFRAGELTDAKADEVLKGLPKLLEK